ncbi:MAG: hypothetical protein ACI8WB_004838, partial [Phenylobacterium sp.]
MTDANNPSAIGSSGIESLFEDSDGTIWVGLYRNGLDKLDKASGRFTHYKADAHDRNSLSSDSVYTIYQTSDGILWLGTKSGLDKFDSKTNTFTHYTTKQGLSNDTVLAIMGDKEGYLWLTTNHGLNRFDPRTDSFNVYLYSDGIQDNEFSAGAFDMGPSGQIVVGGINGINLFDPAVLQDNPIKPALVFTDFLLYNQSVAISTPKKPTPLTHTINHTDNLVLNHTDRVFSFEFAALHYVSPQQHQYAWQLQGFDEQWQTTDARHRRATYTNIDAGKYVLMVKGSNSDNVFNDQPRRINITVLPAPWRTWWAYSLYCLAIGSIVLVIVRLRAKKLAAERQDIDNMRLARQAMRELNASLEQKVADRTQALQDSIDQLTAAQQQLVEAEKMAALGNL